MTTDISPPTLEAPEECALDNDYDLSGLTDTEPAVCEIEPDETWTAGEQAQWHQLSKNLLSRPLGFLTFLMISTAHAGNERKRETKIRGNPELWFEKGMEEYQREKYNTAKYWYQLAAKEGYVLAQFNLGLMYAEGQGVGQDYGKAVEWLRLAADQGYAMAQSQLGLMYADGHGVEKNLEEALKWFRLYVIFDKFVVFNLWST